MALENSADLPVSASARGNESAFSAVSWAAIIAGGVVGAAMALILTSLGAGLGLLALSPWRLDESRLAAVGIGTIVWSVIVEVVAFGLGGYVAGRLRTKWARLHGDEVFFRDTAHGFVVWALGTLVSACLVTSAIGAAGHGAAVTAGAGAGAVGMAGTAMLAGHAPGGGADFARGPDGPVGYFADMLMRPNAAPNAIPANGAGATGAAPAPAGTESTGAASNATAPNTATPGATPGGAPAPTANGPAQETRGEVSRILLQAAASGNLSQPDKTYLAQLVATRTGLSEADAEKRVDDVTNQLKTAIDTATQKAKEAADAARKALAGLTLWGFISMLIGAFVASYAASLGGRARDRY